LLVALYECETWSVILNEEHRPELSESRVLRRTLQCEEEAEAAVSNSRLRERGCVVSSFMVCAMMLSELYSKDQIKENDMGGACSTYWSVKNCI
jgi:hypothetical protein